MYPKASTRITSCSCKFFFIILLIFNTLIGCIYYINEQKISTSSSIQIVNSSNPIDLIRTILSNEYDHNDLDRFYNHVKREYSLGLHCQRNQTSSLIEDKRTKFHKYILEHIDACVNQSIDLIILIISKSENYKTRDAIRRTWASETVFRHYSSLNIKYFFLIDFDQQLTHNIQLENDLFNDIIQVDLPQQYTLVTHRVLSIFEWTFRYCYSAKYIFKSDDDIFVNWILVMKFVSSIIERSTITTPATTTTSFRLSDLSIYGYRHDNARVFRSSSNRVLSRYAITHDEYPCDHFPTYLSGYGYLISKKARDAFLYTAYQDPRPFRISDVYLTGIIPEYLNISPLSMSDYIIADHNCERFFNRTNAFACASESHHGGKFDVFRKYNLLWEQIKRVQDN